MDISYFSSAFCYVYISYCISKLRCVWILLARDQHVYITTTIFWRGKKQVTCEILYNLLHNYMISVHFIYKVIVLFTAWNPCQTCVYTLVLCFMFCCIIMKYGDMGVYLPINYQLRKDILENQWSAFKFPLRSCISWLPC